MVVDGELDARQVECVHAPPPFSRAAGLTQRRPPLVDLVIPDGRDGRAVPAASVGDGRGPARVARAARSGRPAASRSACVPRSTTRPDSSSRISSTACQAGEPVGDQQRRGRAPAQPQQRRRSAASAAVGVEVLGRLVEQQHREVGEQGRATTSRCRWPPESRGAVLADGGRQAVGEPVDPVEQADRPRARRRSSASVASGRPSRGSRRSWRRRRGRPARHRPTTRRTCSPVQAGRDGTPFERQRHRSRRRGTAPATAASVDFPAPLGPTTATLRPVPARGRRRRGPSRPRPA